MTQPTVTIDGREVLIENERNLLEVVRKAGIDLPTFCYHSDLSIYGACRLCIVDIEGRGVQGACSTPPVDGMVVKTQTEEIRGIRKIAIELLLANHQSACTTCEKNSACQLQDLARRLGVRDVRFQPNRQKKPVDISTPALVRDPNKCVLCGDCVRMCREIQGIGAIDFVNRGSDVNVAPAFNKDLAEGECVNCGQCASVCPTGALTPAPQLDDVWKAVNDPDTTVIAQIAPAVRVGLGELFGMEPGELATGQIVAALKAVGFDQVYDTCFAADMTVLEEGEEFLRRKTKGENLPLFTSCCPGWVKFAEQYFPELLPNLSSCRSPQQMFGSVAKDWLPQNTEVKREHLVVVSFMPCTAKKFEAQRDDFMTEGDRDVDFVLTTQELGRMIDEAGLRYDQLAPESLDMPFGFKTGAGIIFGNTGGVTEAVLRYAAERLDQTKLENVTFESVRGEEGIREARVEVGGTELNLAVVHGLANAKRVAESVRDGKSKYDLIEVMACPSGCVGGAGQPVSRDREIRQKRAKGLYSCDKTLQLHKPQDNYMLNEQYEKNLGEIGGQKAHGLLHTHYHSRRRISDSALSLVESAIVDRIPIRVCTGTSCFLRGSQSLLRQLLNYVTQQGLQDHVDVQATFCLEQCEHGPNAMVGDEIVNHANLEKIQAILKTQLENKANQTVATSG